MNKLTSLLTNHTSKAEMIGTEDEVFDILKNAKCTTKKDMILTLKDLGHSESSIALTLKTLGILSATSSRQHVNNTIRNRKS